LPSLPEPNVFGAQNDPIPLALIQLKVKEFPIRTPVQTQRRTERISLPVLYVAQVLSRDR
jgi:hypothetical protein